tara:strand:+ start:6120 stop:6290 length:171 start_codon:yes stop_codon:yes gene_type:complete
VDRFLIAEDHELARVLYRVKSAAHQFLFEFCFPHISFNVAYFTAYHAAATGRFRAE